MDQIWRAIVVDDEAPAREVLSRMLNLHPSLKVVGQATCAADAIALCQDLRPDILFLDVQMPRGDGFSVLEALEPVPAVVFVTSHDEFAVRAFEVNAVDYLLKPIDGRRLSQAIARVLFLPRPTLTKPLAMTDRVFLETESRTRISMLKEISGIDAEGNYTRVHLVEGSTLMIRRPMTEWEGVLPTPEFTRIHRSLIINLKCIREIVVKSRDEISVTIEGFSSAVIISRRAYSRLRPALQAAKSG